MKWKDPVCSPVIMVIFAKPEICFSKRLHVLYGKWLLGDFLRFNFVGKPFKAISRCLSKCFRYMSMVICNHFPYPKTVTAKIGESQAAFFFEFSWCSSSCSLPLLVHLVCFVWAEAAWKEVMQKVALAIRECLLICAWVETQA